MPNHVLLPVILLLFTAVGCDSDNGDDDPDPPPQDAEVAYLVRAESDADVNATFTRLSQQLQSNAQIEVFGGANHAENAPGGELRPTRVIFAGSPAAGTAVLQDNQGAGIDLPQRLLLFEDADGAAFVAYDDPAYLADRHGVGSVPALAEIRNVLRQFAESGTNGTVSEPGEGTVGEGQGLVSVESNADALTTYERLRAAVEANENLSVMLEVNHDATAADIDVDLRPTRLIVFGNPALGTPLMQSAQTIGIDLPQKMLVYTDGSGVTRVVYNDPTYLAERHGATGVDEQITSIRTALDGLAATATGQ